MMNKCLLILMLWFSSVAHALTEQRIELYDVTVTDFVSEFAKHLSYPVTVASGIDTQFTLIARASTERYQSLFESLIRAHGLEVVKEGDLRVVRKPDPSLPVVTTLDFEHAVAADLAGGLDEILKASNMPYGVVDVPGRNALVVSADAKLRPAILKYWKDNDRPVRQIYIQAFVFESSVRSLRRLGVDLSLSLGSASVDVIPGLSAAGTVGYRLATGSFLFDFQALDNNSDVVVMSRPELVVNDRGAGALNIGQEVPIVTGSVRQEDGELFQTIDRKSVGISLNINPVIVGNRIRLKIQQNVSSIDKDIEAIDVVFSQRSIDTELMAVPGKSLYLGGLVTDTSENIDRGIPGLRWLPFTALDEQSDDQRVYSVIITPRVI